MGKDLDIYSDCLLRSSSIKPDLLSRGKDTKNGMRNLLGEGGWKQ